MDRMFEDYKSGKELFLVGVLSHVDAISETDHGCVRCAGIVRVGEQYIPVEFLGLNAVRVHLIREGDGLRLLGTVVKKKSRNHIRVKVFEAAD